MVVIVLNLILSLTFLSRIINLERIYKGRVLFNFKRNFFRVERTLVQSHLTVKGGEIKEVKRHIQLWLEFIFNI